MPIFDTYIPTTFRWYDKLEKQNRFKDHCIGECAYRLLTPKDGGLLPFVIVRPHRTAVINSFYMQDDAGNIYALNATFVKVYTGTDYDYIVYKGGHVLGTNRPCGFFTAVLGDGVDTWYSELFYIFSEDVKCHMKVEWWQDCDFNGVPYKTGFRNVFWFENKADVGNRDYRDTTEKVENGERKPITTFQRSTPIFQIDTNLVPDFVFDALKFMGLHYHTVLTLKNSLGSGDIENVDVKGKWLFDQCYCNVTIFFDLPPKLKDGCCDPDLVVYPQNFELQSDATNELQSDTTPELAN